MNKNATGYRIAKFTAKSIVGIGASQIISDVILHNTCTPATKFRKVAYVAGAYTLAWMISDYAEDFIEDQIDAVADFVNGIRVTVKSEETTPAS
jgi:hypothetical protein